MAIDTTNLEAAITAKIAGEDSAVTQSELLQYLAAADRYGVAQYYTSAASLPTANSAMEGSLVLVYTGQADSGNGLYLCTGTEWYEVQDLDSAAPYSFQGSNFGYSSGGVSTPTDYSNIIDKFPFSSDTNATDVGDLTVARRDVAGQSSTTHGYSSGGLSPLFSPNRTNIIDKFSFSSDGNATDVGDLIAITYGGSGQSSEDNGYTSGGGDGQNTIQKFPFAVDTNATDVGDLTVTRYATGGQSSTTHGYASGGFVSPTRSNVIDKFPFTTDANATDVGDLTVAKNGGAGQSSSENGYNSGGFDGTARINVIEKFPFSSDANATDVSDLTVARTSATGQSSITSGYSSGGNTPTKVDVIDKFLFATDANATDVGDLTLARDAGAGQQY